MPRVSKRAFRGKRLKVESEEEVIPLKSTVKDAGKLKEGSGSGLKWTANKKTAGLAKVVGEGTFGTPAMTETTNGPNPMENPVILNHLFRLCTPDVLASCRQVCKQWYDESLIPWRTECPITFTVRRDSIFLTNRYHEPNALYVPLKKFLSYVETPSSQCIIKPYRNIKIVDCELTFAPKQFEEFWSTMSNNVTNLKLSNCEFSDVEDFRKIIFQTCPNLKRLVIDECSFPDEHDFSEDAECAKVEYKAHLYGEHKHLRTLIIISERGPFSPSLKLPISWLEFFSHFQSLTSFVFKTSNVRVLVQQGWPQFDPLTEAIRLVRSQGWNKLPFKSFVVTPPFILSREYDNQRKLGIIRELRLPLNGMIIKVHPQLEEDYLKDTLDTYGNTIESIVLDQEAPNLLFREFPFRIQLTSLAFLLIEDKLFENLLFLKYTPNLGTLSIQVRGDCRHETPTSAVRNTPKEELEHVTMKGLKKLYLGCVVSDEDISSLFRWMPKILDLRMILNDRQFGIVCENWRELKILKVLGDKLTDEGVTGRSCRQSNQMGRIDSVDICPNITYLQDLETFIFMSWRLTSDSVFHGFLGLPNLQKIKSCSAEKLFWDKAARTALKKKKIELYASVFYC